MAVEVLTYTYTTKDEIERIAYGNQNSILRVDDLSVSEQTTLWTEITEEATLYIEQFAMMYYFPEDLANSRWVRSRAAWVGAYFLSQRRGDPAMFVNRFDEITDELQRVAYGDIIIPNLATREDMTPSVSNLIVHDWFGVSKLRVHSMISTGGASGRQDTSPEYPWGWL